MSSNSEAEAMCPLDDLGKKTNAKHNIHNANREKHPKELGTTSNENNPGHQRETIAESKVKGCVNEKGNATKDNPV